MMHDALYNSGQNTSYLCRIFWLVCSMSQIYIFSEKVGNAKLHQHLTKALLMIHDIVRESGMAAVALIAEPGIIRRRDVAPRLPLLYGASTWAVLRRQKRKRLREPTASRSAHSVCPL